MPCLSGEFNPDVGVHVQVGIGERVSPQEVSGEVVPALVDTGADKTCVSGHLAQQLGLRPVGKAQVQGATGSKPVNVYHVTFMLNFGDQSLVIDDLVVHEFTTFPSSSERVIPQVLIGRDILCRGVFTMDFTGHFTLSL